MSKVKRNFLITSALIILFILLSYMRERKLIVSDNTDIYIEYKGKKIELSTEVGNEFRNVLNGIRIHRPLNFIDIRYPENSAAFIRIHDRGKGGKIRGILEVCLDDISKAEFLGTKPNGRYRVNEEDMKKVVDFIFSKIISWENR
ncbi:hypothetical protein [Enterocloster bolteae]|uniref:hypothetical protein n=1 Tax=Enterocloster bolteae TaxID=208479 RepID=UPI0028DC2C0B|nr:hypothetical protein [Enterocloster bolteae]